MMLISSPLNGYNDDADDIVFHFSHRPHGHWANWRRSENEPESGRRGIERNCRGTTIPYHTTSYHTIPHHTIPCHGIERNCDQNQSNLENRRGDYDDFVDYNNTIIVTNITINTILICNCRFMEPLRTWFRIINCMLPLHLERKWPEIETWYMHTIAAMFFYNLKFTHLISFEIKFHFLSKFLFMFLEVLCPSTKSEKTTNGFGENVQFLGICSSAGPQSYSEYCHPVAFSPSLSILPPCRLTTIIISC